MHAFKALLLKKGLSLWRALDNTVQLQAINTRTA